MHFSKSILSVSALLALALVGVAPTASADSWLVDINTSALPAGTYSLDFTMTGGTAGTTNVLNNMTISGFQLTGGGSFGLSPSFTNSTGSFTSSFTLSSGSNFLSEATDSFSSLTDIKFFLFSTTNATSPADLLQIGLISGSNYLAPYISTTSPSGANELADVSITNPLSVSRYTTTSPAGATISFTAVPEPSSAMALVGGLGVLCGLGRMRRRIA